MVCKIIKDCFKIKKKTKTSTPLENLLDEEVFMGLFNKDQHDPCSGTQLGSEAAGCTVRSFHLPYFFLIRNAERQKDCGEIQQ